MPDERHRVAAFCPLCVSRCGCEAVVEDGRLVGIEPDPSHPTGKALCAKGRASPELVEATDRLLDPMRRTRPKGDPDPGWQRITWDEALTETATAMRRRPRLPIRREPIFSRLLTEGHQANRQLGVAAFDFRLHQCSEFLQNALLLRPEFMRLLIHKTKGPNTLSGWSP